MTDTLAFALAKGTHQSDLSDDSVTAYGASITSEPKSNYEPIKFDATCCNPFTK
jgi:hypothetical protein